MASGIAEHGEARRKEIIYLRKAYMQMQKESQRGEKVAQNQAEIAAERRAGRGQGTSYDEQVMQMQRMGCLGNAHDAETVDRQRRLAHYKQQEREYSAKLHHRYSSIDYISQW